jgi:hypothetical protein
LSGRVVALSRRWTASTPAIIHSASRSQLSGAHR